MIRSVASRVMWVGRATVFTVGLAVIVGVVFGLASLALAHTGSAGLLHLGHSNTSNAITRLAGTVVGPMVRLDNNSTGTAASALDLQVEPGKAPMTVNSSAKVANLNADQLDGKSDTDFYAAGSKVADSESLDGKDFSAFGATEVIRDQGPLPLEGTFTSNGGTLIILASGSGYRSSSNARTHGRIGMDIYLNTFIRWDAGAEVFTNEQNSHKAFVDLDAVVPLPEDSAGQYTIRLEDSYNPEVCNTANEFPTNVRCTTTDRLDFFRVTVLEIPA
jgi:hypothetical protein